jgi:hypothetical protein
MITFQTARKADARYVEVCLAKSADDRASVVAWMIHRPASGDSEAGRLLSTSAILLHASRRCP